MRVERRRHRVIARRAIALMILSSGLTAGCRSTGAARQIDTDPAMQALVRPAETAEIAALPDDPVKTVVAERCLLCHGPGLITQQRKDAAAWGRTVTQMRAWGTPIQDADQAALVTYLTAHFGPAAKR